MPETKIAPGLMMLLEDFEAERHERLQQHGWTLSLIQHPDPRQTQVHVFIECDPDASLQELELHGVRLHQDEGPIRTARVPLNRLELVARHPAVHRLHPSRQLKPAMDVAPGKVHLPAFVTHTGLRGRGVLIGIIDGGIDPRHPAFARRILRIWDQTLPGAGVPEGPYGVELLPPDLGKSRDQEEGHGTHVAGIAAGGHGTYGGVAPAAELIVVKSNLSDAHILDGLLYIFRVAAEMGRPAVVNMSFGGHFNPHDGTDPLSRMIDQKSGPGRIVCCAAGNDGEHDVHASAVVPAGDVVECAFYLPAFPPPGFIIVLDGWYSGQDQIEVAVAPHSSAGTPFQSIKGTPRSEFYPLAEGLVRIATPGPDPDNQDHNILITIEPVVLGQWKVRLRGVATPAGGRVHIWSQTDKIHFTEECVDRSMLVGSPAAATQALTVGSYTTKIDWVDIDRNPQSAFLAPDTISAFSSPGPLRNGARKPDFAAPGAMIVSARSATSSYPRMNLIDKRHVAMKGTSMAAPFVTGIVALLLERNPQLDPAGAKAILSAASAIPRQPPGTYDAKWGYGLIDGQQLQ